MNPFTIPLIAIPVAITFYASFVKGRWARLGLLLVATTSRMMAAQERLRFCLAGFMAWFS